MPTRAQIMIIARLLLDFRGRADRRAMGAVTIGILAVQFLAAGLFALAGALDSKVFLGLNLALLWIGGTVLLRRLHDIGWSGWWVFAAIAFWLIGAAALTFALMMAVGPDRFGALLTAYPALHGALVVLLSLPPFGGLLWLQACPGMPGANRFGDVPSMFGFATGPAKDAAGDVMPDGFPASARGIA